jgi:DNA-binding CsgD family transcriptional regulator
VPEEAPAVLVIGQRGLTRDIVRHALSTAGLTTVDLVALSEDPDAASVVVAVSPTQADWEAAEQLGARMVVVADTQIGAAEAIDLVVRGADAVVDTDVELDELAEIVESVATGSSHLTGPQVSEAVSRLRQMPRSSDVPTLTRRELDILASIDRGDVVKQTARELDISAKTVQNIQSRLFRKLGARNRAHAVAVAHELGLLRDDAAAPPR